MTGSSRPCRLVSPQSVCLVWSAYAIAALAWPDLRVVRRQAVLAMAEAAAHEERAQHEAAGLQALQARPHAADVQAYLAAMMHAGVRA